MAMLDRVMMSEGYFFLILWMEIDARNLVNIKRINNFDFEIPPLALLSGLCFPPCLFRSLAWSRRCVPAASSPPPSKMHDITSTLVWQAASNLSQPFVSHRPSFPYRFMLQMSSCVIMCLATSAKRTTLQKVNTKMCETGLDLAIIVALLWATT